MRRVVALTAALLVPALALGAENVTFAAVPSQGGAGLASYTATLAGGYTLGAIDWDGLATPIETYTYGSELQLDISGPLGTATFTLGTGSSYSPSTPFSGASTAFLNLGDPAGDWTFDFYESYDDGSDLLPDATWDSITFGFNEYVPDTDEADFLAQLGTHYLEDFDGYTYGSYTEETLDLGPVNGFSYTMSAYGEGAAGLWSGDGNMSTNSALNPLLIEFTGDAVTHIGGYFFASNIGGDYIPGEVIITLSDGTVETLNPTGPDDFAYFISGSPIASIAIDAVDDPAYAWATVDHLYVGVPEPASLLLIALGGLALRRR